MSYGLCGSHRSQQLRGQPLRAFTPRLMKPDPICTFDGCDRRHDSKGLCKAHYKQHRAGKTLTPLRLKKHGCIFDGCVRPHCSKGYCSSHNKQIKLGVPLRPLRTTTRHWGDYHISPQGYAVRRSPETKKIVYQHREVMEQSLGRPLFTYENVHHVNGVRSDNRLENLELWSSSQPSGQRVQDKVAWAVEILNLYRAELLA